MIKRHKHDTTESDARKQGEKIEQSRSRDEDKLLRPEERSAKREVRRSDLEVDESVAISRRLKPGEAGEVSLEKRDQRWTRDPDARDALVKGADRMVEERYGEHLKPEAKGNTLTGRIHFQESRSFEDRYKTELKKIHPSLRPEEVEASVLGVDAYTQGERVYVNSEKEVHFGTLVHEKIHQVSDGRFRRELGEGLDEGVTEHLSRGVFEEPDSPSPVFDAGTHHLKRIEDRTPRYYEQETEVARRLSAIVGDDAIARAKFRGDFEPMREKLERELGDGAFDRLRERANHAEDLWTKDEQENEQEGLRSKAAYEELKSDLRPKNWTFF